MSGENCVIRLQILNQEDEMGAVCSMHEIDEDYIQNLLENLKGRDQLGDA
jgi:hypothetical protein